MGNTSSSSIKTNQTNENTIDKKVPKHLQPIKRSKTRSNSRIPFITNNKAEPVAIIKKKESPSPTPPPPLQQQQSKHNKTLIPHTYTHQNHNHNHYHSFKENDATIDQSVSTPQLFLWKRGRRFQNAENVPYPLPNDQTELDRHRVQFYVIRWAFESRHITPPAIKQKLFEGIRVLEVGCGPGIWTGHPIMDMAEDFCKSRFDAIDISIVQDLRSQLLNEEEREEEQKQTSNFRFTVHNVLEGPIPFESNTFDYVEQSITTLAYKVDDWPRVLQELKRVTKPGGYIQLIEPELYLRQLGPQGEQWQDHVRQALRNERGTDPNIASRLAELLTELGLEEVSSRFVSIPIGQWGLDIGNLWEQNVDAFFESARPFLVDIMHITNAEYKLARQKLKEELKTRKAFSNIYVAYGRKKES